MPKIVSHIPKKELWPLLERAFKDEDSDVRDAAIKALKAIPTHELIDTYWELIDPAIVAYLVFRLYETPVTVEDTSNEDQQIVVLHLADGKKIKREKSKKKIQDFVKLIKLLSTIPNEEREHLFIANSKDGWMPLHIAAKKGYLEVVKYLIEKGARIEKPNDNGWTPL